jgi:hypothetical protein
LVKFLKLATCLSSDLYFSDEQKTIIEEAFSKPIVSERME